MTLRPNFSAIKTKNAQKNLKQFVCKHKNFKPERKIQIISRLSINSHISTYKPMVQLYFRAHRKFPSPRLRLITDNIMIDVTKYKSVYTRNLFLHRRLRKCRLFLKQKLYFFLKHASVFVGTCMMV